MKKTVRFHDEARAELVWQATYYELRAKGFGERFGNEIEAAIEIASTFPYIGSPYKYGTRRVFPKKFPFSIVYRILEPEVIVLEIGRAHV